MNRTAEVPLTEMTQEQLIWHVTRLEQKIHELTIRNGEQTVRENEKLRTQVYSQGSILDQIIATLRYHGFVVPDDAHIWGDVSRMGHRMKAAEENLAALPQHESNALQLLAEWGHKIAGSADMVPDRLVIADAVDYWWKRVLPFLKQRGWFDRQAETDV